MVHWSRPGCRLPFPRHALAALLIACLPPILEIPSSLLFLLTLQLPPVHLPQVFLSRFPCNTSQPCALSRRLKTLLPNSMSCLLPPVLHRTPLPSYASQHRTNGRTSWFMFTTLRDDAHSQHSRFLERQLPQWLEVVPMPFCLGARAFFEIFNPTLRRHSHHV